MINELCKASFNTRNIESIINNCPSLVGGFLGGIVGGLVVAAILMIIILSILVSYVYFSAAWYTIAKKLNHKRPWLAWIPFARTALILQLGGFHWAWVFLILIPIAGWIPLGIISIIAIWNVFEQRRYPGWLILISVLLSVIFEFIGFGFHAIIIGLVAWKDKKVVKKSDPNKSAAKRKKRKK